MALFQIQFFSDVLKKEVSVNAIIPQTDRNYKTLYLLHGLSDNHSAWQRYTNIEQYALRHGIGVIMPDGERSFYTDTATGDRFFTYVAKELPAVMKQFFSGISDKKEDTFVAGLSMGGYGAMKLALNYPERYFAAGSFSGALDIPFMVNEYGIERRAFFTNIFGSKEQFEGSENDLCGLLKKRAEEKTPLPRLYISCGTEDRILPCSERFMKTAGQTGTTVFFTKSPGNHNWVFWNEEIRKFLSYALGE